VCQVEARTSTPGHTISAALMRSDQRSARMALGCPGRLRKKASQLARLSSGTARAWMTRKPVGVGTALASIANPSRHRAWDGLRNLSQARRSAESLRSRRGLIGLGERERCLAVFPRISTATVHGGRSSRSNWRPRAGSTSGTPDGCTRPAATSRRRSSRRPTINYAGPARPLEIQSAESPRNPGRFTPWFGVGGVPWWF
jgi:hypothetical protein